MTVTGGAAGAGDARLWRVVVFLAAKLWMTEGSVTTFMSQVRISTQRTALVRESEPTLAKTLTPAALRSGSESSRAEAACGRPSASSGRGETRRADSGTDVGREGDIGFQDICFVRVVTRPTICTGQTFDPLLSVLSVPRTCRCCRCPIAGWCVTAACLKFQIQTSPRSWVCTSGRSSCSTTSSW